MLAHIFSKVRPSGEISPNLVTLDPTKTKARSLASVSVLVTRRRRLGVCAVAGCRLLRWKDNPGSVQESPRDCTAAIFASSAAVVVVVDVIVPLPSTHEIFTFSNNNKRNEAQHRQVVRLLVSRQDHLHGLEGVATAVVVVNDGHHQHNSAAPFVELTTDPRS